MVLREGIYPDPITAGTFGIAHTKYLLPKAAAIRALAPGPSICGDGNSLHSDQIGRCKGAL